MDRVSENAATVPETGVGVLDKAMVVMRAVSDAPRGLAELQASTGLPRATAHRLASALEAHGLLRRDASGRFELGHGLVALGQLSANRFPLVDVARPVATALRDATGEAVQVFVREGSQRRCVLSLESAHGLRWIVPEGSLLPIEVGSSGRLLEGEPARNGWMQSVGEREAGVASVSAPIHTADGAIIGALSVSGPVERLTKQPGKRFGTMIVAAASEIRL
ncbi:MAG: IclR family transcriptional regulator [Ilumatobacter sp.]|jgi:DNA-binding IclR family transcriptional regulator|nr:IclR family transcriptional regulator [Ilumatobacter sp.]MDG1187646.1 IclR family transcriptional regulator [Ilumatobacter sp.]MDG1696711.1 IclR family transcriptional regulator [Ilumatobacter sp.]MDG2439780.1 IclR family transcriptional regulator [Ilumatobacter sp.]|tara:strand:- start:496 stop:1158 length:663 start_codon:yes stop_codon:yes gene_type:complete